MTLPPVRFNPVAVVAAVAALAIVGCGSSAAPTTGTAASAASSSTPAQSASGSAPTPTQSASGSAPTALPTPVPMASLVSVAQQTYPHVSASGSSAAHFGVCDKEYTDSPAIDLSGCPFTETLKQRIIAVWPSGYGKAPRSTAILCFCNAFPSAQQIVVNPPKTPIPSGAVAVVLVTDPSLGYGAQRQTLIVQQTPAGELLVSDIHIVVAGADASGCTDMMLGTPPYLTVSC